MVASGAAMDNFSIQHARTGRSGFTRMDRRHSDVDVSSMPSASLMSLRYEPPLTPCYLRKGQWTITDVAMSRDNSFILYSSITPIVHMVAIPKKDMLSTATFDCTYTSQLQFWLWLTLLFRYKADRS